MLKKCFLLALAILLTHTAFAQFRIGIRGGLHNLNIEEEGIAVFDDFGDKVLDIALQDVKNGVVGGLVFQIQLGSFLIQPEVLFSNNKVVYEIDNFSDPTLNNELLEEEFQYFDIPILLGYKLGPLRLNAGPEAHVFVNNASDLVRLDFYRENFDDFTFGWLAGAGVDFWKFMLDVRYEGNFSAFGDHIQLGDATVNFNDDPSRWTFSLGFLF